MSSGTDDAQFLDGTCEAVQALLPKPGEVTVTDEDWERARRVPASSLTSQLAREFARCRIAAYEAGERAGIERAADLLDRLKASR